MTTTIPVAPYAQSVDHSTQADTVVYQLPLGPSRARTDTTHIKRVVDQELRPLRCCVTCVTIWFIATGLALVGMAVYLATAPSSI